MFILLSFFITYRYFITIVLYLLNILSPSQNKTKQKVERGNFQWEEKEKWVYEQQVYEPSI